MRQRDGVRQVAGSGSTPSRRRTADDGRRTGGRAETRGHLVIAGRGTGGQADGGTGIGVLGETGNRGLHAETPRGREARALGGSGVE